MLLAFLVGYCIKMLHVLLVLLVGTWGYTAVELDKGSACLRLTILYQSLGDNRMFDILEARTDLDKDAFEDRMLMDLFNFCVKNVDSRDVFELEMVNSRDDLIRFDKYIYINEEKYKSKEIDLNLRHEELAFREAAMAPRAKSRIAHADTTQEALRFAEKIRQERREAAQGLL